MWTTQASAISSATPEAIWKLYTDVTCWKEWDGSVISSSVNGAFEPGSQGSMTLHGNPHPLGFELLEVETNRLFRDVTEIPGARLEFSHHLEPTADGTRITHVVTITGPAWEQVAATAGKGIEHGLPQTVRSLAELAACTTLAAH
jgi:uncharacterized protein YndB with AHSA1/START domain